MSVEIATVLALLAATVILFATEKLSVDIVTLIMLVALVVCGVLTPEEAFSGFSNEIIFMLGALFVLSGAVERSGLMDALGSSVVRLACGSRGRWLTPVLMTVVTFVSGFMNNTTATAVFVSPVLGVARKCGLSPSKLLMPIAFGSILGGTCTLIGTSTNVAVSGYIARSGLPPLGFFEFSGVGLILAGVGIAYMATIGQRLLPEHPPEEPGGGTTREYLSEIVVLADSPLIGQVMFTSEPARSGFRFLEVIRGDETFIPEPSTTFQANDRLIVEGPTDLLLRVKTKAGLDIHADVKLGYADLATADLRVVEMLVTPQSELRFRTLRDVDFRERYGLTVLAIHRHGARLREKLSDVRLQMGDVLLVQGPAERLNFLRRHHDLWLLEEMNPALYASKPGIIAVGMFAFAVALSVIGVVPTSIAFLGAAIGAVLVRAIPLDQAYRLIDWRLLVLIGGMTAFGTAMDRSGAAGWLAEWIVRLLQPYGTLVVLAGFFVVTILLTQPMSNAAAALVVLPVAMQTARAIDANPRTFAIAIMLAASVSLVAPFEPACILVYGPGRYRFADFVKVGSILTVILAAIILATVPLMWPLAAR